MLKGYLLLANMIMCPYKQLDESQAVSLMTIMTTHYKTNFSSPLQSRHQGGTSHLSQILFVPVSLRAYFEVVMLFSLFI